MVDVVILSLVTDQNSYEVTEKCAQSFCVSDLVNKIYIIESIKNFFNLDLKYANDLDYHLAYNHKTQVVIPNKEFNYNEFLNIGKSYCSSDYIVFSNNDLIVEKDCIENLYNEFQKDSELVSVCPVDRNWHRHSKLYLPSENKMYTGYTTALHMFGCIYMVKKSVFDIIGNFDEQFFFFYQDDDFAATLCKHKLKHGILTSAHVKHKIAINGQPDGGEKYRYTPENMNSQGNIFGQKWKVDPRNEL